MSEKIIITEDEAMLIDVKPPTQEEIAEWRRTHKPPKKKPPTAAEIEENKKRLPWLQRDYSKWEKEGESNP